jgi:aminoglycoside phosphotransferase (APT) family kinase protein
MSWEWTPETLDALGAFLRERDLCHGTLTPRRIGDGHSNLTFLISDGNSEVVLRRPPPPPVPPGGHDVLREARVIQALTGTAVPVAEVLAIGQPGEVLDVPFYVMQYVPGVVITEATPAAFTTSEHRQGIAETFIDRLADLHAVDWRARGLEGFGRPEAFNQRHLRRIASVVTAEDGNPPAAFATIQSWLAENVPAEAGASIVHNDYRIGNVMFAPEPPARMLAVLDWELATIGDPLLDIGYVLSSYPRKGEPRTPTQDLGSALLEPGYPPREALAERYAERTGRDLTNLSWYMAMSDWKIGVLYEYARRRGEDPYYADPSHVQRFLAAAHRAAGLDPVPVSRRA